jgi:hypothetical protein
LHPTHLACPCSGMKLLITPLLSGLLENDFNKMTEFDDFFKEIEKINRKKVLLCTCLFRHEFENYFP